MIKFVAGWIVGMVLMGAISIYQLECVYVEMDKDEVDIYMWNEIEQDKGRKL